jgi:dsRNA-specific ribonuclease
LTGLGVLWGVGGLLPDRVAPALQALARHGLTSPGEDLTNAIRMGLTHRSFRYENQALLPGVAQAHLDALATLGSAFLHRTAAIDTYERYGDLASGVLYRETNHIGTLVPRWSEDAPWLRSAALLGNGLSTGDLPKKAVIALCHQLLGVLCLAGESAAAAGLVTELYPYTATRPDIFDSKTALQEMLSGKDLTYTYSRTGPDHGATYYAEVTDGSGRRGTGSGVGKGAAGHAAAWDFIQAHYLDMLPAALTPTPPRTPAPITAPVAHVEEVTRLQELFALPNSARGLLSQSLIHQSWAYENSRTIQDTQQRDNQTLAFVGKMATRYEYTRAVATSVLSNEDTIDSGIPTPRNETYVEAFRRTGCEVGLLLGRGMACDTRAGTALAADTFQALFATVLVATRYPPTLAGVWPDPWQPIWDLIAPGQARPESAKPRLDGISTLIGLSVEYRTESHGPDHAHTFSTVADVDSAVIGRLATVTSPQEPTKAQAREYCAARLITLIDILAEVTPHMPPDLSGCLVQFLVAHLATKFAADPSGHQAWARKRLLGLHLVHTPSRLLAWADAVDRLIGNDLGPCSVTDLAAAYAVVMPGTSSADHADVSGAGSAGGGPLAQAIRMALKLAATA